MDDFIKNLKRIFFILLYVLGSVVVLYIIYIFIASVFHLPPFVDDYALLTMYL